MDEIGICGVDAITLVALILLDETEQRGQPVPQHNSVLTGQIYLQELLLTESTARFKNVTRMDRPTFQSLLLLLETHGGFGDSKYISAGEKLLAFILVLTGNSNREINERWQHSGSTISLLVHEVAETFKRCQQHFWCPVKRDDPTQPEIAQNPKFGPYFANCIGALDGTHIPAIVPSAEQRPFRNRKKQLSQNVLGVANFNQTYSYALTGWEGSAHDSRVLNDAKLRGLPLFPGKYYLGDAGYALSWHVLTPYRGVRYHLKEWRIGNEGPQNARELFNLRHSSLRNVVERIFGVVKKRFPLLVAMQSYSFLFQCDLISCTFMLHNFIRTHQLYDDDFDDVQLDNDDPDHDDVEEVEIVDNVNQLNAWRNGIADAMWEDYLNHLNANDD